MWLHTCEYSVLKVTKVRLLNITFSPFYKRSVRISFLGNSSYPGSDTNVLKMNVMLMSLYLLQILPVHIPRTYFLSHRTEFTCYVWQGKLSCISRDMLTRSKDMGGVGLQDPVIDWHKHRAFNYGSHSTIHHFP